jgi:hypothetical protein
MAAPATASLQCQRPSSRSLHIYYKNTRSKQYLKAAKRRTGLRTETTINNAYDFGIGRRLRNLPALRQIGFEANRRILEVEKLTHDCCIGQQSFQQLQQPANVEGSMPRRCVLATQESRLFLPSWYSSAFNPKDSVTKSCGHYLRRL